MASTVSRTKSLKIAFSYGLGGGPVHSRKFRRMAQNAGLKIAPLHEADIIIAHSAGCWLLPPDLKPKLIIYIGMPLAEGRPRNVWAKNKLIMTRMGGIKAVLNDSTNAYYVITQLKRNLGIIRRPQIGKPREFPKARAVFISNRHDPWPRSPLLHEYLSTKNWAFISMPSTHDHLWSQPDYYLEVIKHYAGLLEKTNSR